MPVCCGVYRLCTKSQPSVDIFSPSNPVEGSKVTFCAKPAMRESACNDKNTFMGNVFSDFFVLSSPQGRSTSVAKRKEGKRASDCDFEPVQPFIICVDAPDVAHF